MNAEHFSVKKQANSNKTIRMPDDLICSLQRLADENNVSFNQVVVQCCRFALGHMKESRD